MTVVSLRALIFTGLAGATTIGALWLVGSGAIVALADRGAALAAIGAAAVLALLMAIAVAYFTAVLDVARIRLVLSGSARAARSAPVIRSIGFTLGSLPALAAIGLAYAVLGAAIGAAFVWVRSLTGTVWGGIAAALLLHQAAAFGRTWLRTAAIDSELSLVRARWPLAAAAAVDAREPVPVSTSDEPATAAVRRSEPVLPATAPPGPQADGC